MNPAAMPVTPPETTAITTERAVGVSITLPLDTLGTAKWDAGLQLSISRNAAVHAPFVLERDACNDQESFVSGRNRNAINWHQERRSSTTDAVLTAAASQEWHRQFHIMSRGCSVISSSRTVGRFPFTCVHCLARSVDTKRPVSVPM